MPHLGGQIARAFVQAHNSKAANGFNAAVLSQAADAKFAQRELNLFRHISQVMVFAVCVSVRLSGKYI